MASKSKQRKQREGKTPVKSRNYEVLFAILHCKGGRHPDRKKEAGRKACRQKVTTNAE